MSQPETECETDGEEDLVSFHLGGLGVSGWQSVILYKKYYYFISPDPFILLPSGKHRYDSREL